MQISRVQIKNLLSISSVDLRPGKITQIVGANNAGKTTILKAIQLALQGTTDGSVVRNGEDHAEIILNFDDDTVVRRRIKADGSQNVSVKNKEGFSADRPQEMLNGLINPSNFNPLDLLDPKRRTEALLKCIDIVITEKDLKDALKDCPVPIPDLDYAQHGLKVVDSAYKYFYGRRSEANKVLKEKKAKYDLKEAELPVVKEMEKLPSKKSVQKKIDDAEGELQKERLNFSLNKERVESVKALEAQRTKSVERGLQIEAQVDAMKKEMDRLLDQIKQQDKALKAAKDKAQESAPDMKLVEKNQGIISDCQKVLTKIAEQEALEERIEHVQTFKREADEAEAFSKRLDSVVQFLSHRFKADLMASAKLPVKGLTYEDGQFFLEGSSIDNLSSSKAIHLSVAIARKLAGKAKIICLDGAEALDNESYEALRKEVEGDDFSYFVTRVGTAFQNDKDTVVTMEKGAAH